MKQTTKVIICIAVAIASATLTFLSLNDAREEIKCKKSRNEHLLLNTIVEEIDFTKMIEEHTFESNGKLFVTFTTFSTLLPFNLNQKYWDVIEKHKDIFITMAAEEYEKQAFEMGYRHYMFEEEYDTAGKAPITLLDDAMYIKAKKTN